MKENKINNKLKFIVFIIIVIVIIITISILIIVKQINNNNSDEADILSIDEQYAVDYLLCNSSIKPYQAQIHKVWIYKEYDEYYFAYYITFDDISRFGDVTIIYGNSTGITIEELSSISINNLNFSNYDAPAKELGYELDAEKIQKAFEEQY